MVAPWFGLGNWKWGRVYLTSFLEANVAPTLPKLGSEEILMFPPISLGAVVNWRHRGALCYQLALVLRGWGGTVDSFAGCPPRRASQVALVVQNPSADAGDIRDAGSVPGSEDPPEEEMATHSGTLAWRISWTEEPGGLQSTGLHRVGHD